MIDRQFFDAMANFTRFGSPDTWNAEPSNREILNVDHKLIGGMKKLGGLLLELIKF